MIRLRAWALGVGLTVLLAAVGVAAPADKAKGKNKAKGGLATALDQLGQLLPPDPCNKLKLTDGEKKQVDTLQTEFGDKSKDVVAAAKDEFLKNRDAIRTARQAKDKAALKQAMTPVREKVQDFVKLRGDYVTKVRDVLNDDQKTTFDQLSADNAAGKGPLAGLLGKAKGKAKKKPDAVTQPKPEEPKKDAPKTEDPKKDEPKKDAPKTDDPTKKDEPKKDEPKKDEPMKDK